MAPYLGDLPTDYVPSTCPRYQDHTGSSGLLVDWLLDYVVFWDTLRLTSPMQPLLQLLTTTELASE